MIAKGEASRRGKDQEFGINMQTSTSRMDKQVPTG